ncbi:hypothetical protein Trydic_g22385 [Trypoxylus dichotomus]
MTTTLTTNILNARVLSTKVLYDKDRRHPVQKAREVIENLGWKVLPRPFCDLAVRFSSVHQKRFYVAQTSKTMQRSRKSYSGVTPSTKSRIFPWD